MGLAIAMNRSPASSFVASNLGLGTTFIQAGAILTRAANGELTTADARVSISTLLPLLEEAGIMPHQVGVLREFADGTDLPPERLAEVATRLAFLNAVDVPTVHPHEVQEAFRHLVGPSRPSLVPATLRPRSTTRIQVVPEGMEDRIYCPVCHVDNAKKAKFCNECAQPLIEAPDIRPENRVMTLVFCDLKGFDDFSKGLRPDTLFSLMNEVLAGLCAAAISEGGHPVGSWGDAVFLAFSTPDKPMEDHAIRAVRASLKMQDFMRSWSERQQAQGNKGLDIRMGVNTGEVSWGVLGLPGRRDQNGMGEEINIAARLEPIAYQTDAQGVKHGAIAISQTTLERLDERFDTTSMGETTVKTRTVRYHLVKSERPQASILMPKGTDQVKFIGRKAETDLLKRDVTETIEGKQSRLTVVTGEAGLGKTRLGMEFIDEIARSGAPVTIVAAHGEDLPAVPPFHAMAKAIERMTGAENRDSQEERRQKLLSLVQRTIAAAETDLELTTQLLGNLIGVEFEDAHPVIQSLRNSAEDLRERTLDAVVTLFDHASRKRPVVFIMEDLHWVDRGSARYLDVLLDRLKDRPFLVIALTRPEFWSSDSPLTFTKHLKRRIDLAPLSRKYMEEMLTGLLGPDAIPEVREFIIKESRGNPYILQEMGRSVRAGWMVQSDGQQSYLVAPDGKRVPAGAQGFLQSRIDHLPESQRRVLKGASVIGAEFTIDDLEGVGLTEMGEALDALTRQSLLIPVSAGRYQFPHALLRDTVYGQIQETEKQGLHRAVATQLIESKRDEFALIASHMERAGEKERAAEYYFKAAEGAAKVGAYRTASSFYGRTYDLSNDPFRKLHSLFGWEDGIFYDKTYEEGTKLLSKFDAALATVPSGNRETHVEARFHKARILAVNKLIHEAIAEVQEALSMYRSDESTEVKCLLLDLLFRIYWLSQPDYQKALEVAREGLHMARVLGKAHHIIVALLNEGLIESTLGALSGPLASHLEAARLCREVGDLKSLMRAINNSTTILILLGMGNEARPLLMEGIEMSRRQLNSYYLDWLLLAYGQASIYLGRYDEAIPYLNEGVQFFTGRSLSDNLLEMHLHLALAYEGNQDWLKTLESSREALRIAQAIEDEVEGAKAKTIMARAHLGMENIEDALQSSQEAINVFLRVGAIAEFDDQVLLTQIKVLIAAGRESEAMIWADRAKRMVDERASRIANEEHRTSFLTNVPPVREILRLWHLLRLMTAQELSAPVKTQIERLRFSAPATLPDEARFVDISKVGEIQQFDADKNSAAGVVLDQPLTAVFASLLSRGMTIKKNPGEIKGIWAKEVRWEPFFSEDGTLFAHVKWEIGSRASLHSIVLPFIGEAAHREEILQDRIYSQDGSVYIEFKRFDGNSVTSNTGAVVQVDPEIRPRKHQFGEVRFILIPTPENRTILILEMGRGLYTQNPWNFLSAFVDAITSAAKTPTPKKKPSKRQ